MIKHRQDHLYPQTSYNPRPLIDIKDEGERKRLSHSAFGAFLKIMDCWKVSDEDQRSLLGGISNGTLHNYKNYYKESKTKTLSQDVLIRISLIIGIFKALNILHNKKLADKWISLPNNNPIFANNTPLEYLKRGGALAMQDVRQLLDARREGR